MANFKNKIRGEYCLEVVRGGETLCSTGWRPNLITDTGLDSLAQVSSNNSWRNLSVGTGTTAPAPTDTALASRVAGRNISFSRLGVLSGNTCTHTGVCTFELGSVVGNITELGLSGYSSGPLFTRALITDLNGDPTSVTVTAEDQLVVTYRVIFTVDMSIQTATVVDPNTDVSYTIQAAYETLTTAIDNYGIGIGALGSINSGTTYSLVGGEFGMAGEPPSGGTSGSYGHSSGLDQSTPYVPGTFRREARFRYPAAAAMLDRDGINIMRMYSYCPSGYIKFHFDPPFRKPSTNTCELGWVISWERG